jgi:heterodisulfide reductase subunit A
MARIGVFICHCGVNIAGVVDIDGLRDFAGTLEDVVVAKDYKYMCSDPGGRLILHTIKEDNLDSIVVASCSPRIHEETFRSVMEEAGLNPYCLEMANIREHCSWVHMDDKDNATKKASDIIAMAVAKARLLEPLEKSEKEVVRSALVIGGGIAGIQASLDLGDQGFTVYLVEQTPSIGGRMSQLDKTFPTLDCSSCILTPKMMDVGKHKNIELMTYSEVTEVEGSVGNFKVTIKKKPRYVDMDKCTGCGACAEVCRLKDKVADEFNMGLGKRSAVYVPFPQAVPMKYTVDPEKCIFLKTGKCGDSPPCLDACGPGAIDHEDKEEEVELEVGVIIVATGYDMLDGEALYELGYALSPNVITNLEFERFVSSSGPTKGEIVRPSDQGEVKSVSFVLCVGSRDEDEDSYCCRIGCMGALKHAYLIREHLGPDVEINIFYNDIRAFGKGYEDFYRRVRGLDVNFFHGRPSEIRVQEGGELNFDIFDSATKKLFQVTSDLVVLVPALVPRTDVSELARMLRISQGVDDFFLELHPKLKPMDTATRGIFLAGCCQGPKDIPDTVAMASGAAVRASIPLSKGKIELDPMISFVVDKNCDGCAYCIDPCPYGSITLIEYMFDGAIKKTVQSDEALCQGCGVCMATCPKQGIFIKGFKIEMFNAMVDACLRGVE